MTQLNKKDDAAPIISVSGLCTRFGTHTVHQDLSLDVKQGEVLGVVGGSGT
ncbi:MAG: ABC transporter ATP-binding protein, partial [Gammaproteobacteria bacterium]|nr:ABC transporter ATP-binding protein [Gammaproteobacteria bacterium]